MTDKIKEIRTEERELCGHVGGRFWIRPGSGSADVIAYPMDPYRPGEEKEDTFDAQARKVLAGILKNHLEERREDFHHVAEEGDWKDKREQLSKMLAPLRDVAYICSIIGEANSAQPMRKFEVLNAVADESDSSPFRIDTNCFRYVVSFVIKDMESHELYQQEFEVVYELYSGDVAIFDVGCLYYSDSEAGWEGYIGPWIKRMRGKLERLLG